MYPPRSQSLLPQQFHGTQMSQSWGTFPWFESPVHEDTGSPIFTRSTHGPLQVTWPDPVPSVGYAMPSGHSLPLVATANHGPFVLSVGPDLPSSACRGTVQQGFAGGLGRAAKLTQWAPKSRCEIMSCVCLQRSQAQAAPPNSSLPSPLQGIAH